MGGRRPPIGGRWAGPLASLTRVSRYTSATDADRAAMLATIGVDSTDELFADIPAELRLDRPLELPDGLSETEVFDQLRALAARNADADSETCFIGAGMYDHYVPGAVDAIISRSEFLTPYTPYQPEVSQGGLQVMFEFQTAISELTGLPVANASLYEGPSSVASAAYLALGAGKGRAQARRLAGTASALAGDARDLRASGSVPRWSRSASTVESPMPAELAEALDDRDRGASSCRTPTSSARSRTSRRSPRPPTRPARSASPPSTRSRSACCARRASAASTSPSARASRSATGSTSAGHRSASSPRAEEHLRRMPGRIAGETTDVDGRRGFVLALQTREQHIRREKATHNICTSQALNALAGTIYLAWLGRARDRRARRAAGAADGLRAREAGGGRRGRAAARGAGGARVRVAAGCARGRGAGSGQ